MNNVVKIKKNKGYCCKIGIIKQNVQYMGNLQVYVGVGGY